MEKIRNGATFQSVYVRNRQSLAEIEDRISSIRSAVVSEVLQASLADVSMQEACDAFVREMDIALASYFKALRTARQKRGR